MVREVRSETVDAVRDHLTGLAPRQFLTDRLRQPRETDLVLLHVDLDNFKDVNDQLGHDAGDKVLAAFAQRLQAAADDGDLVVRLGGDEFAVLTTSSGTEPRALGERLVRVAAEPYAVLVADHAGREREHLVTLGASVGIARTARRDTTQAALGSADSLLTRADLALGRAKLLGRGRVEYFESRMADDRADAAVMARRRTMERRLRSAIAEETLALHYQPIINLLTGAVTGVEALARWTDDELGVVRPDIFIELAETTGLIIDLGRWVLHEACAAGAAAGSETMMSVNVSPVQLREPSFIDVVRGALDLSGLPAHLLCLEVTETAAITDLDEVVSRLRELRGLGVKLALDDFGTGHSSLTLLRWLPLHTVKVDASLVHRVAEDAGDAVLVRLLVEASHSLGLRVCAEGIESEEQASQLLALGCDSAQGYLFGRPAVVVAPAGKDQVPACADRGPARLALRGSDDLVIVVDRDDRISFASVTCYAVLGVTPQQLVGLTAQQVLGPLATGQRTLRLRHSDGGDRWVRGKIQELVEPDGSVRETLCVLTDVTQSVQRDELLRGAFESAPIGIALSDLDGRLLRVNPPLAQLLGRPVEELLRLRVRDITHPDDLAADAANLNEARRGDRRNQQVHKRYLHADGSAVRVVVDAAITRDPDGAALAVVAYVQQEPDVG